MSGIGVAPVSWTIGVILAVLALFPYVQFFELGFLGQYANGVVAATCLRGYSGGGQPFTAPCPDPTWPERFRDLFGRLSR